MSAALVRVTRWWLLKQLSSQRNDVIYQQYGRRRPVLSRPNCPSLSLCLFLSLYSSQCMSVCVSSCPVARPCHLVNIQSFILRQLMNMHDLLPAAVGESHVSIDWLLTYTKHWLSSGRGKLIWSLEWRTKHSFGLECVSRNFRTIHCIFT